MTCEGGGGGGGGRYSYAVNLRCVTCVTEKEREQKEKSQQEKVKDLVRHFEIKEEENRGAGEVTEVTLEVPKFFGV